MTPHHGRKESPNYTRASPNYKILKVLKTPPKLENYDKIDDLREQVENVDTILNSHQAINVVKCKMIVLTQRASKSWFMILQNGSIESCKIV